MKYLYNGMKFVYSALRNWNDGLYGMVWYDILLDLEKNASIHRTVSNILKHVYNVNIYSLKQKHLKPSWINGVCYAMVCYNMI